MSKSTHLAGNRNYSQLLGLDNLTDYREFLFEQEIAIAARNRLQIIVAAPLRRPRFYDRPDNFTLTLKA